MHAVTIAEGFAESHREEVARLFWEAFGAKLARVMAPEGQARAFISRVLRPERAISALDSSGRLLGVAGFKTVDGGLVAGTMSDLAAVYGWTGALWRGPLLDLTERPLTPGQLLLDGIFVAPEERGRGVGTALITAVIAEARARGICEIRLDVIDSNPRARALYEREGFRPAGTTRMGPLAPLFGFRAATTMIRQLHAP